MGPGGGQNQTDSTANFFWLILFILLVGFLIWYLKRQWFVEPIFFIRQVELVVVKFFVEIFGDAAKWLNIPTLSVKTIEHYQDLIAQSDPGKISAQDFSAINDVVARWARFPLAGIMFVMSVVIYFKYKGVHFRTKYTMPSLLDAEREHWPQIEPVVSINLVKADPNEGPWAMSKTPMMLCQENDLIFPTVMEEYPVWGLKRGPAFRIFSLQLGRLYTGVENLPIHVKALVVIFVARAERDRKIADNMIRQVSGSAQAGSLNFDGVEELIQKYKDSKAIAWVGRRHAYIVTFMATLLEVSRSDGVLASSEFLWVKPVDRRLWYMLNHVGRQAAVIEVSGAVSHWIAEKSMGRPLRTPMVKPAVDALEEALAGILRKNKDETWHSRGA